VESVVKESGQFDIDFVDLAELNLPFMDEPNHPAKRQYTKPHTIAWSERVDAADAFIFVTPEYNHSYSAALKNAIDFLYAEWTHKAAGFVSYGSEGGVRAVEQLRQVMAQVRIADVGPAVALSLATDFVGYTRFQPRESHAAMIDAMLSDLLTWSAALSSTARTGGAAGR